jgi:hypothetical protein
MFLALKIYHLSTYIALLMKVLIFEIGISFNFSAMIGRYVYLKDAFHLAG